MNSTLNPPWDTHLQSSNPLDTTLLFAPQKQDIFQHANLDMQLDIQQKTLQIDNNNNSCSSNHNHMQDNNELESNELLTINTFPQQEVQKNNNTSNTIPQTIALALKYRPRIFSELVGQESIVRTLCLALESKKIANAYLFSGLRGSGKTSSARILARSLQCQKDITPEPCGICPSCQATLKGTHIDIIELDGASNRKIDDIRDLIEQTKYKPTMGRFKIFIIDEVHMLTREAFNSLLKTLEEPPNYVKFILATTDPLKVPPTILSRTQHFRFKKIPTNALRNHLTHILHNENVQADTESINMLIRNGHGSLRDTLTLLDQAIVFCENVITTQKLADMLGSLDPSTFDSLFQALLRKNTDECMHFVHSLEGYETEMILDELSLYIKNKMLEEIPQIPPILGMRYANIINDSKAMLQLNCDGEFCLLLTILKMLEAQKIKEIDSAIKHLENMQHHTNTQNTTKQNHDNTTTLTHNHNITIDTKQTISNQDSHTLNSNQENITTHNKKNNNDKQNTAMQNLTAEYTQETNSQQNTPLNHLTKNNPLFLQLIQKIYERDYQIGKIFEQKIAFEKIEANTLFLTFYTNANELTILKQGYSGIIQLVREVFGNTTKLQVEKKLPSELEKLSDTQPQQNLAQNFTQPTINMQSQIHQNQDTIQQIDNQHTSQTTNNHADDIEFMHQNHNILKTMQSELGVKNVKVISLDKF